MLSPAFGRRIGQNRARTFLELAVQTRSLGDRSIIGWNSLCRSAQRRLRRHGRERSIDDLVATEQHVAVRRNGAGARCPTVWHTHGHWFRLVTLGEQEFAR